MTSAAGSIGSGNLDNISGFLGSYGVRFYTRNLASDIAFVKPITSNGGTGGFLLGLPFINVSYRWN